MEIHLVNISRWFAAALLLKNPRPPASGRPHPAWGLMYLQLTAAHLGAAAIFAM